MLTLTLVSGIVLFLALVLVFVDVVDLPYFCVVGTVRRLDNQSLPFGKNFRVWEW